METKPFPVGSETGIDNPSLLLSSLARKSSRLRSVWNCTKKDGAKGFSLLSFQWKFGRGDLDVSQEKIEVDDRRGEGPD